MKGDNIMGKYYNTSQAQVGAIKELVSLSDEYDSFKIKFESPIGDVLYLRRTGAKEYERYMPISNLFGLGAKKL